MTSSDPEKVEPPRPPTFDEAMANAARLLRWAEGENDLARMKAYDDLASSWAGVGALMMSRGEDA